MVHRETFTKFSTWLVSPSLRPRSRVEQGLAGLMNGRHRPSSVRGFWGLILARSMKDVSRTIPCPSSRKTEPWKFLDHTFTRRDLPCLPCPGNRVSLGTIGQEETKQGWE